MSKVIANVEREPKIGLLQNTKIKNLGITTGVVALIFLGTFITKGQSYSKDNFNTAYFKINPSFSSNSLGDYSAVWETNNRAQSSSDIRLQSFYEDGLPKTGELIISTEKTLVAKKPSIAMNDAGEIVVVWPANQALSGIFLNKDLSEKINFSIPLNAGAQPMQPAVIINKEGIMILTWGDKGDNSINYQLLKKDGKPVSTPFKIKTHNTDMISSPKMGMNTINGDLILLWQEKDMQTKAWNIFMQRMHKDGTAISNAIQVNSTHHNNPVVPDVIMNNKGETMVLWQMKDFAANQNSSGILLCKIYDNDNNPVKDEFLINTSHVNSGAQPLLATNNAGNFVLIWKSLEDKLYNEITEIIPNLTTNSNTTTQITIQKDVTVDSTGLIKKEKKCVLYIKGDTVTRNLLVVKSFRAAPADNGVRLEWITEMEQNDFDFIVERSENGREFKAITTIQNKKGTGTNHYDFTDNTPYKKSFYRLKQVSKEGQSYYLGTISAGWENEGQFAESKTLE